MEITIGTRPPAHQDTDHRVWRRLPVWHMRITDDGVLQVLWGETGEWKPIRSRDN